MSFSDFHELQALSSVSFGVLCILKVNLHIGLGVPCSRTSCNHWRSQAINFATHSSDISGGHSRGWDKCDCLTSDTRKNRILSPASLSLFLLFSFLYLYHFLFHSIVYWFLFASSFLFSFSHLLTFVPWLHSSQFD